MAIDSRQYYDAAKGEKRKLTEAFSAADIDILKPKEEPAFNAVVARARSFLMGFANIDTESGAENVLTDAGFSGSVSSVILGSSAPNYDTGMGGSAGKEDEEKKKRQEEWDRLFMLQQQLAQRLQEIDWKIEEIDRQIHDTKEHMSALDREKAGLEELRGFYDDHLSGRKRLEVGADGKLKNEKVEKTLQEFERRTGKKIDRKNPEELDAALRDIDGKARDHLNEIEEEYKRCQEELERYRTRKEELTHERKTTEKKLDDVRTKLQEAESGVEKSVQSGDKAAISTAMNELKKAEKTKQNEDSGDFNNLNELNDIKVSGSDAPSGDGKISLSISAASSMDRNTESGLKGNFKIAHGQAPQQEAFENSEMTAQNKNLAAKPIS